MLEELLNLVKQSSQEAVIDNPEIPNEQNAAVMEEAGSSVVSTLQSMLAGGQASQVMSLFGNNSQDVSNNAVTQNASGSFINNITQKLGISPKVAAGIAAVVIPMIMSKLVKKTNDPSDSSFNIQDIFNLAVHGDVVVNEPKQHANHNQDDDQVNQGHTDSPMRLSIIKGSGRTE